MKKADFTINLGICLETSKLDEVCDQFRGRGGGRGRGGFVVLPVYPVQHPPAPAQIPPPPPHIPCSSCTTTTTNRVRGGAFKKGECLLDRKK